MAAPPVKPGRETEHLVVLKFSVKFGDDPWHVFLFEDGKRLFRVDFRHEGPAAFLAAKLVSQIRRNGWRCRWSVQDEDGHVTGADVMEAIQKVKKRRAT